VLKVSIVLFLVSGSEIHGKDGDSDGGKCDIDSVEGCNDQRA